MANRELFEWQFYAADSESVMSNSGIAVPAILLGEARNLATLIVCAPADAHDFDDTATLNWLRKLLRKIIAAIRAAIIPGSTLKQAS